MGGQGCCKQGNRTLQDEYQKGSSKPKKDKSVVLIASVVDCFESRACRDR
jgi:hypothetical protein